MPDEAPSWLTETGKEVWRRLAPDLRQLKFLRRTDGAAFARYCDLYADWIDVVTRLRRLAELETRPDGAMVYETDSAHGMMRRVEPLFKEKLALNKELVRLEQDFGLNPAARYSLWGQQFGSGMPKGGLFDRDAEIAEPSMLDDPENEGDDLSPSAALRAMVGSKQIN